MTLKMANKKSQKRFSKKMAIAPISSIFTNFKFLIAS